MKGRGLGCALSIPIPFCRTNELLFCRLLGIGWLCGSSCISQCLIDSGKELLVWMLHLNEGRTLAVGRDDPDRGRVIDASAPSQIAVCLHCCIEFALRIESKGQ